MILLLVPGYILAPSTIGYDKMTLWSRYFSMARIYFNIAQLKGRKYISQSPLKVT